ncbi:MAG: type II toxin-antitoxin system VapC family toxin, partial [Candidatus Hadarchaeota archaeon]|nr:type II toxin-antitoxin system VapC family toxin [Candidatus Hadarchaeota archaeon]
NVFIASLAKGDPNHQEAIRVIHEMESDKIRSLLPRLVPVEICGAIARVFGRKYAGKARELLILWRKERKIKLFNLDKNQQELAEEIAIKNRLKGADAIIIALSKGLNADLVTFDRELARAR